MTKKQEIISFKVDQALADILHGIPNRSDFIRKAILMAMENICPLCSGTGILSPEQRTQFESFSENHSVQECSKCHAVHIVCVAQGRALPNSEPCGTG